jgi:hypothetical protein
VQQDFPEGPPILGKVYAMDHNFKTKGAANHETVRIIVMSHDSWSRFGTMLQSARSVLAAQDKRIKELVAESHAKDRLNADMLDRLNAIREIRRAEKRAELEPILNLQKETL